jgi:hypothetical protein
MAGVIPDESLQYDLDQLLLASRWATAKLRLYTNNITPSTSSVVADFTEATFTGYAAITLPAWPASTLASHIATSAQASQTFTITSGSQNVYGWYITDSGGTHLLAAQRDPAAPVALSSTGTNTYSIQQSITAQSA